MLNIMQVDKEELLKANQEAAKAAKVMIDEMTKHVKELSQMIPTATAATAVEVKEEDLIVIVDAGHGGLHPKTGKYMTFPNHGKYYQFNDGFTAYEGETNRLIADKFCSLLSDAGVQFEKIYHPFLDSHLATLVQKANQIAAQNPTKKTVLFSFHSNAIGMSNQGAGELPNFWSVWTSRGSTKSDKIADVWFENQKEIVGDIIALKSQEWLDRDKDFEADFTILFGTAMPAVLCENLFFTSREGAEMLYEESYQDKCALAAFDTVKWIVEQGVHKIL